MTLRKLPALRAPDPSGTERWDLHPQARARWAGGVGFAAKDDTTISILEPIGADWFGEGVTAKRIAAALRSIGDKPVTVLVNSPGGDFFEGLAIYNLLREHPKAVTVQIVGVAASAASVIAMAGDTIQIGKAALMFVHNTQWFAAGDRHVMAQAAEEMAVFDQLAAQLYAERTGMEEKVVARLMDRETFLGGEEAVAQGFADELLARDEPSGEPKAVRELPAAYRIEALLERHGVPRADRRRAVKEIVEAMPGAGLAGTTPGAGSNDGTPGAADLSEGLAYLRVAAMRAALS